MTHRCLIVGMGSIGKRHLECLRAFCYLMGMKVLLINPNRTFLAKNVWSAVNSVTPPLGLALLASVLEQDGHHVDVLDAYALELDAGQVVARIDASVDMVGLSAMTVEIDDVKLISSRLREKVPELRIVLGGVHPTIFHKELLEEGVCDLVVR